MNSFSELWNSLDFSALLSALIRVVGVFLCLSVHETCHGLAAYALGDPTAKREHRLSLNPLHHIDWLGFASMLLLGFGWAKPVPVDMRYFKKPKQGMALTALAGPVSNLLLAIMLLLLGKCVYLCAPYTVAWDYVYYFFMRTAALSVGLGIFNLIPIPPLDGSKVLLSLLSDSNYYKLLRYERYGMILMILLVSTGIIGKPLSAAMDAIYNFLLPLAQWGADLSYNLFFK